jgi:hypothetical protein
MRKSSTASVSPETINGTASTRIVATEIIVSSAVRNARAQPARNDQKPDPISNLTMNMRRRGMLILKMIEGKMN